MTERERKSDRARNAPADERSEPPPPERQTRVPEPLDEQSLDDVLRNCPL
jgi:hypothetical protein